jgi:hypothetical protein
MIPKQLKSLQISSTRSFLDGGGEFQASCRVTSSPRDQPLVSLTPICRATILALSMQAKLRIRRRPPSFQQTVFFG